LSNKKASLGALKAGYDAYYGAYSTGYFGADHKPQRIDVPYTTNPQRDLWLKGWRFAQKTHERGGHFSHTPQFPHYYLGPDKAAIQAAKQKAQAAFKAKQKSKDGFKTYPKNGPATVVRVRVQPNGTEKRTVVQRGDVNLNRLENRFNKKNRTVV